MKNPLNFIKVRINYIQEWIYERRANKFKEIVSRHTHTIIQGRVFKIMGILDNSIRCEQVRTGWIVDIFLDKMVINEKGRKISLSDISLFF